MTHLQHPSFSPIMFSRRFHCLVRRVHPILYQRSQVFQFSGKLMEGLLRCPVNDVPLTPISFLERAASVYRDRTSIIYGSVKYTWSQTMDRCLRLASALTHLGISRGDVVAVMSPNVPAMYELHFGVPMAGAVLCTLNIRHDSQMVYHLLRHSEAKIIFVDSEFFEVVHCALELFTIANFKPPVLILISESDHPVADTTSISRYLEYESLLGSAKSEYVLRRPKDEWEPISLNYTSGTTSSPKGVVYNHRGSYLNSLCTVLLHGIGAMPTYLWTVPMFHCNGWCLIWGMAAQGGTNICLRKVTSKGIFDNLSLHTVTHMGGAPTVLNMIVNSAVSDRKPLPCQVEVMTGGSPPPPEILSKMEELGFNVNHMYGLTETCGPGTICTWKPEWDSLSPDERAKLKSRQGQQHLGVEVDIKDPVTFDSVPPDGITMGEVMFRGNTIMSGYFKNAKATQESFAGGWFRSGDLAVKHADGYIKVKDRSKDIIISGGENISTAEVEAVLYSHPAVLEAAVVGRPDDHWGETPCAFVKLKDGCSVNERVIIEFCRDRLPHYMAPRTVVFDEVPKTSTGKVQKFLLKEKAKKMGSLCANETRSGIVAH